jgi:hypothetical protein
LAVGGVFALVMAYGQEEHGVDPVDHGQVVRPTLVSARTGVRPPHVPHRASASRREEARVTPVSNRRAARTTTSSSHGVTVVLEVPGLPVELPELPPVDLPDPPGLPTVLPTTAVITPTTTSKTTTPPPPDTTPVTTTPPTTARPTAPHQTAPQTTTAPTTAEPGDKPNDEAEADHAHRTGT